MERNVYSPFSQPGKRERAVKENVEFELTSFYLQASDQAKTTYLVSRFLTSGLVSIHYSEQMQVCLIQMNTASLTDHVMHLLRSNGYSVCSPNDFSNDDYKRFCNTVSHMNVADNGVEHRVLSPKIFPCSSYYQNDCGDTSPQKVDLSTSTDDDDEENNNSGLNLSQQSVLESFLQTVTISAVGQRNRVEMLNKLQQILSFGKLHPFGSFISGIGSPSSDVDVYFETPMQNKTKKQLVIQVSKILKQATRNGRLFARVLVTLPHIRVPIVRFLHLRTHVHCDISFENLIGVTNTKLIKFLLSLTSLGRPLAIFLRHWAQSFNLICQHGIKNYALTLLIIVFLTRKKLLPKIELLQNLASQPKFVPGTNWNIYFCENEAIVRNEMLKENIGEHNLSFGGLNSSNSSTNVCDKLLYLTLEFFNMLKNVLLVENSIIISCNSDIVPIKKQQMTINSNSDSKLTNDIPMCYQYSSSFDPQRPIILQDPFALDFDVLKACQLNIFQRLIQAIDETTTKIQKFFYDRQHGLITVAGDPPKSNNFVFKDYKKMLMKFCTPVTIKAKK